MASAAGWAPRWAADPPVAAEPRVYVQRSIDPTGRVTQIPFHSVSFTEGVSRDTGWTLVVAGDVAADMALDLRPWAAAVFLRVGGWWTGGLSGPRTWDRGDTSSGTVTIRGASWMGWLARRHITSTLTYTDAEQYDIAADVLGWCQTGTPGKDGGDLAVELIREPTNTGRTRDRVYDGHELKSVRDVIAELGEVDDGFEWLPTADWPAADPAPRRLIRLGYPNLGDAAGPYPVITDGDRAIVTAETYDAANLSTVVHATGQAVDPSADDRPVQTAAAVAAGIPKVEQVISHDTTSNPSTLLKHAVAELHRSQANYAVTARLLDHAKYPPGSFRPGDRVRVTATGDGMHAPAAGEHLWRVVGRTVNVGDRGQVEQTVELMRDDQLVVPGPHVVSPADMRAFRRARRRRRQEELRQKVGTKKP